MRETAVVAVPYEMIGNRIAGAMRDWCLERLPHYMVPETFELIDPVPETSTGKTDRTQLARR